MGLPFHTVLDPFWQLGGEREAKGEKKEPREATGRPTGGQGKPNGDQERPPGGQRGPRRDKGSPGDAKGAPKGGQKEARELLFRVSEASRDGVGVLARFGYHF